MAKIVIRNKKLLAYGLITVLGSIGITLLVLPADHFDQGRATCLSVVLFDMNCYGCGMTRAIQHLIHLEFNEAWNYNKLAFIVFPLAVYMICWELKKMLTASTESK